jgi:hypothetical protein
VPGENVSTEPFGKNFEFGIIMTFSNSEDFEYYIKKDPVHSKFSDFLASKLDDIFVFDIKG